jgi:hypothetical protein
MLKVANKFAKFVAHSRSWDSGSEWIRALQKMAKLTWIVEKSFYGGIVGLQGAA